MTARGRATAAALASVTWTAACGSPESTPGQAGAAAARAVVASIEAAGELRAPWRCAAPAAAGAAPVTGTIGDGDGDRRWRRDGAVLRTTRTRLVIAAVAQARGAAVADPLRAALADAHPDVVLALGGMGGDQAELERALAALAVPGAVVVALPGDAEPWPALTAAVDHLAAGGAAIVDGAAVRTLDAGVAVIATLPGLAHAERLGAGADGCLHDGDDVTAALATLAAAAGDRPRLLVGPRAPQGGGAGPTADHDRIAGVHAGDPALTAALAGAGLTLVVHGLADVAPVAGAAPTGTGVVVAAGSLDLAPRWDDAGRPRAPTVTVAVVDDRGVRWRSLPGSAW